MEIAVTDRISHTHVGSEDGVTFEYGAHLPRLTVAYRTYGRRNRDRSNVVLICRALAMDQYVAESHRVTGKNGWWEDVVGPGRPVDTKRLFVICCNVLGGCMGSTGPLTERPDAPGTRGGTDFPPVTIGDMVRAQNRLTDQPGNHASVRGARRLDGQRAGAAWVALFPDAVFAALPITCAADHSARNIAFREVGRQATFADPDWQGGRHWADGRKPARGLRWRACARTSPICPRRRSPGDSAGAP